MGYTDLNNNGSVDNDGHCSYDYDDNGIYKNNNGEDEQYDATIINVDKN